MPFSAATVLLFKDRSVSQISRDPLFKVPGARCRGIVAATERATAQSLLDIRRSWQERTAHLRADATARRLLDVLLGAPVQTAASARAALGVSAQAANTGIAALLDLGILREATGRRWGRSFRAYEVLAVLEGGTR